VNPAEKLYPRVVRGGSFASLATEISSAKLIPEQPDWKRIDPQIPKSQWWFPEAPFLVWKARATIGPFPAQKI